jgi:hypothetical protein
MRSSLRNSLFLVFMVCLVHFACREALISSADERKEGLIQGEWLLQSSVPQREGSISLIFEAGATSHVVHIVVVNSSGSGSFDFNFRIEDGDLYFLSLTEESQEIEFVYDIEDLTEFNLVLSFTESSGQQVTQTYVRP